MELDCTGDGGGWSSTMGESMGVWSPAACLSGGRSLRLARDALDRPLLADRTEAASAAFSAVVSPFDNKVEFLGLSVLALLPGILERRDRNDRDDSLVSDRLKEG
jgi:hypothetical protein